VTDSTRACQRCVLYTQGCLALAAGDLIVLTDSSDDDWWFGQQHSDPSLTGAFPRSFVAPAAADDAAAEQQQQQLQASESEGGGDGAGEGGGGDGGGVEMEVECPEGVEAGMAIVLTTPDGMDVEVAVPEGIAPGDVFTVFVAAATPGANADADDAQPEEEEGVGLELADADAAAEAVAEAAEAAEEEVEEDGLELEKVKGRYKLVLLGAPKAGKSALYSALLGGSDGDSNVGGEYAPTLGLAHQKVQIEAHCRRHFRKEMTVEVSTLQPPFARTRAADR
jgi:hypothetical protein